MLPDERHKPAFTWQIPSWCSRPENSDEILPSPGAVPELEHTGEMMVVGVSVARACPNSLRAGAYVHNYSSSVTQRKAKKSETSCLQGFCCKVVVGNRSTVQPLPEADSAVRFCPCPAASSSWRKPLQEAKWVLHPAFCRKDNYLVTKSSLVIALMTKIPSHKTPAFSAFILPFPSSSSCF